MSRCRWFVCLLGVGLSALGCGAGGSNACDGVDCSGHGSCAVRSGQAVCICEPGFLADGLACAADPCASFPCVHGTCAVQAGQAACQCAAGYAGALCDACATGFHPDGLACVADAPCGDLVCVHGACQDSGGQVSCACDPGYAGEHCDECAPGYHPDGLACVADTACDPDPCAHGSCAEVDGQAACTCFEGYAGDLCDACAPGYRPEGLACVPDVADPCDPNPCDEPNRSVCRAEGDGFTCECDPGFHEEDDACVEDVVCDPATTCSGNGACTGVGLECACDTGYSGDHCDACATGYHDEAGACVEDVVDPCDPNPCQDANRTVCTPDGQGGHTCACDPGFQDSDADGTCWPNCETAGLSCGAGEHCAIVGGQAACVADQDTCPCDPWEQDNDGDGICAPTCTEAGLACGAEQICSDESGTAQCVAGQRPPIHIAFHWHMHQPIYWPYEDIAVTEANNRMGFSVYQVHFDRSGPYGTWPRDAVDAARAMAHAGAQVSFSGSLMENLNNMAAAGAWGAGWQAPWIEANGWDTAEGNPRLDIVAFGYHHPLMGLIDEADIRLQLAAHREARVRNFGVARSKGLFPPECAFSERMIPALAAEGIEWVLVDNIHFDRAHRCYPWVPESNLPPPNPADQLNAAATDWVQLNDLWAPSRVAAPWGYRPHWVEYVDPGTGQATRIVAVPAARYEGNEDARGGFGALQYEAVMSQYEHLNTDPDHPMLVVLHHDGDNYGGGTDSYYHANFSNFVNWVQGQPDRFVTTTIQDYLDRFPPAADDVIHVEDGSWAGADNGDPEFLKWNGDPNADGYSPDRNSWAVLTAVKNRVLTAEAIQPHTSIADVVDGTGSDTDRAWHFLLNAETSCYWYWDFSEGGLWDSHPTRAANQAATFADSVIGAGADTVGPTIYLPQREPYNPGLGLDPSDFWVWTYVYDLSGLTQVQLHLRVDADGQRDAANEVYSGGTWQVLPMQASDVPSQTDPAPAYKASGYQAQVSGLSGVLVDYFVSAEDGQGNQSRSPLMHVWVGSD